MMSIAPATSSPDGPFAIMGGGSGLAARWCNSGIGWSLCSGWCHLQSPAAATSSHGGLSTTGMGGSGVWGLS